MHDEVGHADRGVGRLGLGELGGAAQAGVELGAGEHEPGDRGRVTTDLAAGAFEEVDLAGDDLGSRFVSEQ